MIHFSNVIRQRRLKQSKTIRGLAEESGLSPTTISLAEKGADIRMKTFFTLCKALGIRHINIKNFGASTPDSKEAMKDE